MYMYTHTHTHTYLAQSKKLVLRAVVKVLGLISALAYIDWEHTLQETVNQSHLILVTIFSNSASIWSSLANRASFLS